MKRGFRGVPRPLLPAMLYIVDPSAGQEAPSVTQPQPSSIVVPPTPPITQPILSEATTIPPLSQPALPTPIAETTTASPSLSPSPEHKPMELTFEQPSTDQQPPTPRQEATTSQLMTRIGDLEKQLKETQQTFVWKAILTLVDKNKLLGAPALRERPKGLYCLITVLKRLMLDSLDVNTWHESSTTDSNRESHTFSNRLKRMERLAEELSDRDSLEKALEKEEWPNKLKKTKNDKPTKNTGKRRNQIARKGLHTDHDKDESEDSDEANEKDDSTSRENGTEKVYISFGAMLTDISKMNLQSLYRIDMKTTWSTKDNLLEIL
ncbi:hypothetical protein Tco_1493825 [Tanacetum coccineum]